METQLTTSGSQLSKLTPFEEAALRAFHFGLALDNCVQLQAYIDTSEASSSKESTWLDKVYIAEIMDSEFN